ncbi:MULTISPECIES: helix-turn-helix transcriptional regulator [Novosphingobium]|uniref:helix-turn-helix transcriptional regulator n=1 Tax=Novosphingobium TaxID=165696 RepID=UPI001CD1F0F3|nr:LuxR C-terminal-related transcriptional regulator [Novosphingobium percolationis]MCH7630057.1 hypothetical protein [Pseudomonadota bacterium]
MELSNNICEYANTLARDCDIDSTCVFIADKTTKQTKIFHLGNFGVDQEVLDRYYRTQICDVDPFTDTNLFETMDGARFHVTNDPALERSRSRAGDYFQFVSQHSIDVVGASTMKLQPRLYLMIGAHRNPYRKRGSLPVERLNFGMDVLQAKIASNLLSSLLAGGKGYRTLLNVVSAEAAPVDARLASLSARETEVARLVCEGKQNKEIAWIASLSECTVENHLRRIYQKLGIHNRAALVARMNGVLN